MDGDVRLAEGNTLTEGRVELCRNDVWGTVCSNGMDIEDARVVCRQLGFSTAGRFTHLAVVNLKENLFLGSLLRTNSEYGQGYGPILLSNLWCAGSEERLMDCRAEQNSELSCTHSQDVGVVCFTRTG